MLALRDRPGRGGKGLSRHGGKGGSIGEYASKISPLVRYCFRYRTDFIGLSDQQFSDFIDELRKSGYNANTEEEIIDKWFKALCQNVIAEDDNNREIRIV
jgi:hypothetical protein